MSSLVIRRSTFNRRIVRPPYKAVSVTRVGGNVELRGVPQIPRRYESAVANNGVMESVEAELADYIEAACWVIRQRALANGCERKPVAEDAEDE